VASASRFFFSLLQPCSFKSVLATEYFFGRCGPYTTFLYQPTSEPRNSIVMHFCNMSAWCSRALPTRPIHPIPLTRCMNDIILKTTTNQPVTAVFLLLHNHHLPRTKDKHCVGIICRGGMALIIGLSLLAVSSFEAISSTLALPTRHWILINELTAVCQMKITH
jgi:hypothetical protein